MSLFNLLWSYFKTKRLKFKTRQALEAYQLKQWKKFKNKVLIKSSYFKRFIDLPLEQWPLMDKQIMMTFFDDMNTAQLKCKQLIACAIESESSKDFSPKVGKFSVGLSSGTSGQRGVFVVSPKEQSIWAGGMLAKMLPRGLMAKERVALFLRSDNNLYQSVNNRWLTLKYFGLFENFQLLLSSLIEFKPTIIVAPAQVLTTIAHEKLAKNLPINPYQVISVAEVLEPQDKQVLKKAFERIGEVYQATEGFLGSTCPNGVLHLNEEFLFVEQEWLDEERFIPIITDFTRQTQPIIRYRLNDVLVKRKEPCSCGRQGMAISHIEGRQDDQIILNDGQGKPITIFADYCSRIIANTLPLTCDYRLIQRSSTVFELIGCCESLYLEKLKNQLMKHFEQQGANTEHLSWNINAVNKLPDEFNQFLLKRRRIIRQRH